MNNKVKFLRGTSGEYAVAEKDSDTIYFTTDDGKLYIGDKEISGTGSLTIDDTLSDTSTNPVQNKVVKQAIDNKADKTVATTETDGLMSASDKKRFNNIGNVYALKSLYGDTTIDVGRKTGTDVGICSDAEGWHTTASGNYSHTEGLSTTASNRCSHAEGVSTVASGESSHAEGVGAVAFGDYSHARGYNTITNNTCETASGKYNVSNDNTLFSIGDGTADNARHNAFEITTTGGKLHDKDIATTDLIPTTLPANGGNADTVDDYHVSEPINISTTIPPEYFTDVARINPATKKIESWHTDNIKVALAKDANTVGGKSASDFMPYIGYVDDLKAVNQNCICSYDGNTLNTPYKSEKTLSSAGICIVNNINGILPTYFVICTGAKQCFISYQNNGEFVGDWKEISATPIKKISFPSIATNAGGGGNLFSADFGTPIVIACTSLTDTQCTTFYYGDGNQWLLLAKDATTLDPIPAGTYSFDVWYI